MSGKKLSTLIISLLALSLAAASLCFTANGAGDGYKRKDGIAAKIESVSAAEDGSVSVSVGIVNESCAYASDFKLTFSLPDGLEAVVPQSTLTLKEGESGGFATEVSVKPETEPVTEPAPESGCGSFAASASAVAAACAAAFALSRGRKRGKICIVFAALFILAAAAIPSGAAVTHRSLSLPGKLELDGTEYSFEVIIEYDYAFEETKGEATTGMKEFGITYYWGPHGEQAIDESFWQAIAECGFTTVPLENNSIENNKIALGYMKKYGLRCSSVWDVRIWQIFVSATAPTDEQIDATVREVVADYADFDIIDGWWLSDEPSTEKFPILGKLVAAFRKYAPDTECMINLFPNYAKTSTQLVAASYESYLKRFCDEVNPGFLSYDHYHFMLNDSARRGFYQNFEQIRNAALENNLDYMSIILLTKHNSYADLTRGQILLEVNTALAYGCKRVSYFTFILDPDLLADKWDNACMSWTGEKYPHYYEVQKINAEILPLGRELYGKKSTAVFQIVRGNPETGCTAYTGYGDLGEVEGVSFVAGFFDDGSFMIANRKYADGEYGLNTLTFIDVKDGLEFFDVTDSSWKPFEERDAEGRYVWNCGAGEGMLFRVK